MYVVIDEVEKDKIEKDSCGRFFNGPDLGLGGPGDRH